jgi:hypothetical protein
LQNIFECIYNKSLKFTSNQAADMRVKGPTCYPLGVDPKDFSVFLEDCCAKADSNRQSHGSPALFDAVSSDKKAADNVDKLSTPGERLSSTHVDPSAHDDDSSSRANANVDGNGNFDPSLRTGEKNPLENPSNGLRTGENADPNTLENASNGLRTGEKDPNTDAQLFRKPKIAAVHLTSLAVPSADFESAPMPQKDVQSTTSSHNVDPSFPANANADPSFPSQNGNANGKANANVNANADKDAPNGLPTSEKDEQLKNAFIGSNEQPDLANAADERHSLPFLSTPAAPQKDVTVNHQSTSANANTHANGNTDPKVAADAHSQSTPTDPFRQSPAFEKTDSSVPVLGAMGGDEKCKCPL